MGDVCKERKEMIVNIKNEIDKTEVKLKEKQTRVEEWVKALAHYKDFRKDFSEIVVVKNIVHI